MSTNTDNFGPIGETGAAALLEQRRVAIAHVQQSNALLDHKLLAVNGAVLILFGGVAKLLSEGPLPAGLPLYLLLVALVTSVVALVLTARAWWPEGYALLGVAPLAALGSAKWDSELAKFHEIYTAVSPEVLYGTMIGDALRTFRDLAAVNERRANTLSQSIALLIVQVLALSGAVLAMR